MELLTIVGGLVSLLALVLLCRAIHRVAVAKGLPRWPFTLLLLFSWKLFGFLGGFGGAVLFTTFRGEEAAAAGIRAGYLFGVTLGGALNMIFVRLLPARQQATQFTQRESAAAEAAYIEWRSRNGAKPQKAKSLDDEEEVVDLQPADARPRSRR